MPGPPSQAELDDIDDFLADPKTLSGPHPTWATSTYTGELQATWGILNSLGMRVGSLRFTCWDDRSEPSIIVTFRDKGIWRVDVVDRSVRKPNFHDAESLGLPASICGSHHHGWWDNRAYVERQGFGALPYRRELPHVRRLEQALLELADAINLTLDDGQRGFDVPRATDLFEPLVVDAEADSPDPGFLGTSKYFPNVCFGHSLAR